MNCKSICFLLIGAMPLLQSAWGQTNVKPMSSERKLFIGTFTGGSSKGIYLADFDTVTGKLSDSKLGAAVVDPSYICQSENGRYLISVSAHKGDSSNAFSYRIGKKGELSLLDSLAFKGNGSCYVSELSPERWAIANYNTGSVAFFKTDANGRFIGEAQLFNHSGFGPVVSRQERAHAHSVASDLSQKFTYVADLGIDSLKVYRSQGDSMIYVKAIPTAAGAGPRHFAIHPSGKFLALVNELDCTIDVLAPDSAGIYSLKQQTLRIIPDSVSGENTAADIHFSADGRFVYATSRGFDCVVVLKVNQLTHQLELISTVTDHLNWPRNFTIDPSGNYLLVANQKGNDIVVFRIDKASGLLKYTGNRMEVGSPVCLKFQYPVH